MWILRKLYATIIVIIIIIIASFYFFNHIETLSIPSEYEEVYSPRINKEVSIYQNNLGISHIIARNEQDAYFMLGYIQARDRLWQMDIKRRTAMGQLSAIFGKEYIPYDKFLRSLNLFSIAEKIQNSIDKETADILNSFAYGVNTYINNHSEKLSFEFSALNYKPKIWKAIDCILLQRLFAVQTSPSFKYELNLGEIAEKIGYNKTLLLLPDFPVNSPYVMCGKRFNSRDSSRNISKINTKINQSIFYPLPSNLSYNQSVKKIYDNFFGPQLNACNNWVVASKSNKQKKSVLVNDFHSNLELPSMWYPIHISYGENNIIGFMMPGIPVFWSGRNDSLSWGISSAMIDDCDFFVEKSLGNKKKYITPTNDTIAFDFVKDTIKIKNAENYYYYKIISKRSPILLDYNQIENKKIKVNNNFKQKYLLSYNWVGSKKSDEISSLIKISKSRNWRDFNNALKTWSVPSLNFSFTDKRGNIGLISCGKTLNRGNKTNPYFPNPGWLPEYDDNGISQKNIIGILLNPNKKFVSASNNILNDLSTPYLSNYWEPDSREKRIEQLIGQYKSYENYEYNYFDAQRMQLDNYSTYAKEILDRILPIIKLNFNNLNFDEQKVLHRLEKWDYLMSPGKTAPTIFKTYIHLLAKNIFFDDLGSKLFKNYSNMRSIVLRKLLDLFQNKSYDFFDNINTKNYESKTYVVITSFQETVKYLENKFKTKDIDKWQFGKINQIKLSHKFSSNDFLKPVVNIKPIKLGGDRTTINLIDVPFDLKSYNPIGSSFRMIVDVSDSSMLISIPGGLSGDPLNPNYKNIVQVWKNGGYIKLNTKKEADKSFVLRVKGFNSNIKQSK